MSLPNNVLCCKKHVIPVKTSLSSNYEYALRTRYGKYKQIRATIPNNITVTDITFNAFTINYNIISIPLFVVISIRNSYGVTTIYTISNETQFCTVSSLESNHTYRINIRAHFSYGIICSIRQPLYVKTLFDIDKTN